MGKIVNLNNVENKDKKDTPKSSSVLNLRSRADKAHRDRMTKLILEKFKSF